MKTILTQKDIALRLGVSQATVSYAFTNSPKVGDDLRKKIVSFSLEHGYRPNAYSRAIKKGFTKLIAVLLSQEPHRSYIPLTMQDAIIYEAQRHNYLVIFSRFSDKMFSSRKFMPRVLSEFSADGIIINYSHLVPPELDKIVEKFRIPVVWINRDLAFDCVCPDDKKGVENIVRQLYQMNHRRIAFLHAFPSEQPSFEPHSVKNRISGYLVGMKSCGLEPMPICQLNCDYKEKSLAFKSWWDSLEGKKPTAIIGYQYADGPFFMRQSAILGIKVPEDVSFIVFSDHIDRSMGIQIDNVVLPEEELGKKAVEMLLNKVKAPSQKLKTCFTKPKWIRGDTCISL